MILKDIKAFLIAMTMVFTGTMNIFAAPELSIPKNITVSGTQTQVPIYISGVSGAGINGFKVRFDYDETLLTNPQLILDDTLCENKNVLSGPPQDGNGGDFLITLFSGFSASEDGILAIIQLDVDPNFLFCEKSFVIAQTALLNASYQEIAYTVSDGILMRFEPGYENNVLSIGKTDNYEIKSAQNNMLTLETSLFENNGFVMTGHNDGDMLFDVPASNGYDQIMSCKWYVDVHGNAPETITMTFSLPQINATISYFGLLASSDNTSLTAYEELDRIAVGNDTKEFLVFALSSEQLTENHFYALGVKYKSEAIRTIPTLNEWGMIFFASLIFMISIIQSRYKVPS